MRYARNDFQRAHTIDNSGPVPSSAPRRNLRKTGFSLWKRFKCFPFRLHWDGIIWKSNNQRLFWICVWGKLGQGNEMIIWSHRFRKAPFSLICETNIFKFFRFEERFRKAQFSWRISLGSRPSRRNKSCVFKFLRPSVSCSRKIYSIVKLIMLWSFIMNIIYSYILMVNQNGKNLYLESSHIKHKLIANSGLETKKIRSAWIANPKFFFFKETHRFLISFVYNSNDSQRVNYCSKPSNHGQLSYFHTC